MRQTYLSNKKGYLVLSPLNNRGAFAYVNEGKSKDTGQPYQYIRIMDVFQTKGRPGNPARLRYRRRKVTNFDMTNGKGTVTSHIDFIPDQIPEMVEMLLKIYGEVTGNVITHVPSLKPIGEEAQELVIKKEEENEEDETQKLIDKMGKTFT